MARRRRHNITQKVATNREALLELAKTILSESKYVDFKAEFDPESPRDWCEIIKDIVAMTNTGGGLIIVGLTDAGKSAGTKIKGVLDLDPAQVTDRIARYVGKQFSDFEIVSVDRRDGAVAALVIGGSSLPLVFVKPGTYAVEDAKQQQRTAFSQGTVYFRHGAKSEPGTTDDLRRALEREISRVKSSWLKNIKKVVKAPAGHVVYTAAPALSVTANSSRSAMAVKITADEQAPAFRPEHADEYWPFRQTAVVEAVNFRLQGKVRITGHDILCIRKVLDLEEKHPDFIYRPFKRVPPQYNDAFIEWLVQSYDHDRRFFDSAREQYQQIMRRGRP
jgi:hypothetical protein